MSQLHQLVSRRCLTTCALRVPCHTSIGRGLNSSSIPRRFHIQSGCRPRYFYSSPRLHNSELPHNNATIPRDSPNNTPTPTLAPDPSTPSTPPTSSTPSTPPTLSNPSAPPTPSTPSNPSSSTILPAPTPAASTTSTSTTPTSTPAPTSTPSPPPPTTTTPITAPSTVSSTPPTPPPPSHATTLPNLTTTSPVTNTSTPVPLSSTPSPSPGTPSTMSTPSTPSTLPITSIPSSPLPTPISSSPSTSSSSSSEKETEEPKKERKTLANTLAQIPVFPFVTERSRAWNEFKRTVRDPPSVNIKVTYDGKTYDAVSERTTPWDISKSISFILADAIFVARVDGKWWDLNQSFEKTCEHLEFFKIDTPKGKEALERRFGATIAGLSPTEDGFYVDALLPDSANLTEYNLSELSQLCVIITRERQNMEHYNVPRDVAERLFKANPFQLEVLSKIPEGEPITIYKAGPFVEITKGPHLPNTNLVRSIKAVKSSGVHWQGDPSKQLLQRVHGICFPEKKMLFDWEEFKFESAKRDHKVIGKTQGLFMFDPHSPGSPYILPHGTRIYNKLFEFIRKEYFARGFDEVITPDMYSQKLLERSGHWENYKEHMVSFFKHKTNYALKPMNCPAHCLIYKNQPRTHEDLPLRLADFGALHREVPPDSLAEGLASVTRFHQDDAHIFVAPDMVEDEIKNCFEFMKFVYGTFNLDFKLTLSTRPQKHMGDPEMWEQAEKALTDALKAQDKPWTKSEGEGAFYGPKIDVDVVDALKRTHRCGSIQLDFQMPMKFNLEYTNAKGETKRPVIIHRVILGSFERFMGLLVEHWTGRWPLWLSPRHCLVIPISDKHNEYARKVQAQIRAAGYFVDIDNSEKTLVRRIREGQNVQYNFMLLVGDDDRAKGMVSIRTRDNLQQGMSTVADLMTKFAEQIGKFK